MINDDLYALILKNFPHKATKEQENVIRAWSKYLISRDTDRMFLLKGYAGTGKTTLVGALVRTWTQLKQHITLLAPTGRAAKVMAEYSGLNAWTIHKYIYRRREFGQEEHFTIMPNLHPGTLFIVDEASMISNEGLSGGSLFGDGRLLDDLIHYVYSSPGCRLIIVGDTAQLPPVMEAESPALSSHFLLGYGIDVAEHTLTEVVRQAHESGILWNATLLRQLLTEDKVYNFPTLHILDFPDICRLPGGELIEALESSYSEVGEDETIVITRSNKRAGQYNQGIRSRILYMEDELCSGDRIMVVKNNYLFMESANSQESLSFIANGDMAVIRRFWNERELYDLRFADAILRFPDYNDMDIECTILLDTLQCDSPALPADKQQKLWQDVLADYSDIHDKKKRNEAMKKDIHLNALQIKYAYAVTCHKAQGGQWQNVFIDQGYITEEMLSADYFRWLYTAITRARSKVYLINWPTSLQKHV